MSEEETAVETPAKNKPGRKAGTKMQRDNQGRLLKKDGTLAKAPGRKAKGSIKKKTVVKKKTRKKGPGRPKGSRNKANQTTFTTPTDLIAAFKSLDVQRNKLRIVARKEIESVACQIAECDQSKEKGLIKKLHQLKELVA